MEGRKQSQGLWSLKSVLRFNRNVILSCKNPESPRRSKLTAKERHARRKSYDASRSRSVSPLPDLSRVTSSVNSVDETERDEV